MEEEAAASWRLKKRGVGVRVGIPELLQGVDDGVAELETSTGQSRAKIAEGVEVGLTLGVLLQGVLLRAGGSGRKSNGGGRAAAQPMMPAKVSPVESFML